MFNNLEFLVIDCGSAPAILHTSGPNTRTVNPYGSTQLYTCDEGYTYAGGDRLRTCDHNENWDGEDMICIGNSAGLPGDGTDSIVTLFNLFVLVSTL